MANASLLLSSTSTDEHLAVTEVDVVVLERFLALWRNVDLVLADLEQIAGAHRLVASPGEAPPRRALAHAIDALDVVDRRQQSILPLGAQALQVFDKFGQQNDAAA